MRGGFITRKAPLPTLIFLKLQKSALFASPLRFFYEAESVKPGFLCDGGRSFNLLFSAQAARGQKATRVPPAYPTCSKPTAHPSRRAIDAQLTKRVAADVDRSPKFNDTLLL